MCKLTEDAYIVDHLIIGQNLNLNYIISSEKIFKIFYAELWLICEINYTFLIGLRAVRCKFEAEISVAA